MVIFGAHEVKGQGRRRPKLDLEAWRKKIILKPLSQANISIQSAIEMLFLKRWVGCYTVFYLPLYGG